MIQLLKMAQLKKHIEIICVLIAVITLVSGILQMVMPSFVLEIIGRGEVSLLSAHFFAIIGMFMALFGGMFLHTVYEVNTSRTIVLWAALQKFGAFFAVSIGVVLGLLSFLAMGVAVFDLLSGILFFFYLSQLKK